MSQKIESSEVGARLPELVSAVAGGERYVIERDGHPVAALVSAEDLAKLEPKTAQPSSPEPTSSADEVTDEDIELMLKIIYEARDRDTVRPVELPDD